MDCVPVRSAAATFTVTFAVGCPARSSTNANGPLPLKHLPEGDAASQVSQASAAPSAAFLLHQPT